MIGLLVLVPLLAGCSAQYILAPSIGWPAVSSHYIGAPIVRTVVSAPVAVPTSSQYHAQDELGQFAFGHSTINQAREEVKSLDGTVRGAYSYVDPNDKLINVQYQADSNGFRILGANNLPVAPEATLEPVKDTPEVLEARANFARAFKEAKDAAAVDPTKEEKEEEAKSRTRRSVLLSPLTIAAKTIIKTSELKPIDDAKVPAATKLAEIKETEKEILTPLTYSSVIASPIVSPLASPLLTRSILPLGIVPSIAKTTITTQELKPVDDAKTPAATKLSKIVEDKKEVLTPVDHSVPLIASPYLGTPIVHSPYLVNSPIYSSSLVSIV